MDGTLAIIKNTPTNSRPLLCLLLYIPSFFLLRTYCIKSNPQLLEFAPLLAAFPILMFCLKDTIRLWKKTFQFWKSSCLTGAILSISLYTFLYSLCFGAEGMGLEYGVVLNKGASDGVPTAFSINWIRVIIEPLLYQTLFTGLILPGVMHQSNRIAFLYFGGILFTTGSFQLNLAVFFLGVISAFLFDRQKSLLGPVIFHANAVIAGQLLETVFLSSVPMLLIFF